MTTAILAAGPWIKHSSLLTPPPSQFPCLQKAVSMPASLPAAASPSVAADQRAPRSLGVAISAPADLRSGAAQSAASQRLGATPELSPVAASPPLQAGAAADGAAAGLRFPTVTTAYGVPLPPCANVDSPWAAYAAALPLPQRQERQQQQQQQPPPNGHRQPAPVLRSPFDTTAVDGGGACATSSVPQRSSAQPWGWQAAASAMFVQWAQD